MNVLMIGIDHTMAMDREKVTGDSQDRHIAYGRYLSNLFIVSFSGKTKGLKVKKLSENVTVYPICYTNPFTYLWEAYRTAKRLCQENKIDVITTQDPLTTGLIGYAMKWKFHLPLNVQLRGDYLDNPFWLKESKLNRILNLMGRFIVKRADCVRTNSIMVGNNLVNRSGVSRERIVTLTPFVNIKSFTSHTLEPRIREKYSQFEHIVLFVGALSKTKNVEALLLATVEVVKQHPKALFLIVGDGKERAKLMRLSTELGLEPNARFEGRVAYEDIPSYYQSCSLLVLPSRHEGWGRVVIEALASGKPVIVSDACGASEVVINGKCGFVFPVDRPDILAERITYLLDKPQIGQEMGERGRDYIEDTYDLEKNAYKNTEVYEKTIEMAKRSI